MDKKLLGLLLLIIFSALYGGLTHLVINKEDDSGTLPVSASTQQISTVLFDPSQLETELGENVEFGVEFRPYTESDDPVKFLSIKVTYDPEKLDVIEVSDGTGTGFYQNTVVVDEEMEQVGLISLVWSVSSDKEQGIVNQANIAQIKARVIKKEPQSLLISSSEDPDSVLFNVVRTGSEKPLPITSAGLEINGGGRGDGMSGAVDLRQSQCDAGCGDGALCVNGACQEVSYLSTSDPVLIAKRALDKGDVPGCDSVSCVLALGGGALSGDETNCGGTSCVLGASDIAKLDIDGDGVVDIGDMSLLLGDMMVCKEQGVCAERSDLNEDGVVSSGDVLMLREYLEGSTK